MKLEIASANSNHLRDGTGDSADHLWNAYMTCLSTRLSRCLAGFVALMIALGVFVVPTHAAPVELSPARPSIRIDTPSGWVNTRIPRGLQTHTKDEELYVWLEVYRDGELNAVIAEHSAYWKKEGIVIRGRKQESEEKDGRTFSITQVDALWNGEPTVLYYMDLDLKLPSGRKIVFTYWASPKADQEHTARVEALMDSITVTER